MGAPLTPTEREGFMEAMNRMELETQAALAEARQKGEAADILAQRLGDALAEIERLRAASR